MRWASTSSGCRTNLTADATKVQYIVFHLMIGKTYHNLGRGAHRGNYRRLRYSNRDLVGCRLLTRACIVMSPPLLLGSRHIAALAVVVIMLVTLPLHQWKDRWRLPALPT